MLKKHCCVLADASPYNLVLSYYRILLEITRRTDNASGYQSYVVIVVFLSINWTRGRLLAEIDWMESVPFGFEHKKVKEEIRGTTKEKFKDDRFQK